MKKISPLPARPVGAIPHPVVVPSAYQPQARQMFAPVHAKHYGLPATTARLPAVPPAYAPKAANGVATKCCCDSVQAKMAPPAIQAKAAAIQMASKGAKKAKKTKGPTKAENSWRNLQCYGTDKAKKMIKDFGDNGALEIIKAFLNHYPFGIRGHCSATSESKPNRATLGDLEVFYKWYKEKYS